MSLPTKLTVGKTVLEVPCAAFHLQSILANLRKASIQELATPRVTGGRKYKKAPRGAEPRDAVRGVLLCWAPPQGRRLDPEQQCATRGIMNRFMFIGSSSFLVAVAGFLVAVALWRDRPTRP